MIDLLHSDILSNLIRFLNLEGLLQLSRTCRMLRSLVMWSEEAWIRLHEEQFGPPGPPDDIPMRDRFRVTFVAAREARRQKQWFQRAGLSKRLHVRQDMPACAQHRSRYIHAGGKDMSTPAKQSATIEVEKISRSEQVERSHRDGINEAIRVLLLARYMFVWSHNFPSAFDKSESIVRILFFLTFDDWMSVNVPIPPTSCTRAGGRMQHPRCGR